MLDYQVLIDPGNEMVFESTFDNLMEEIWCKKFMDISTGKVMCVRLRKSAQLRRLWNMRENSKLTV